jgi:uncharacterized protein YndB with AHSA1/START domain
MTTERTPTARAAMLIRKPVAQVFEAFVDPAVTSRFWFTKSSGRLEAGKQVTWYWALQDVSVQVTVKTVTKNSRILIEWSAYGGPTMVEWSFTPRNDHTTFVSIAHWGFSGSEEEQAKQAIGATEGFALVLAGLKALLEHNVILNLVPDRFPDGTP